MVGHYPVTPDSIETLIAGLVEIVGADGVLREEQVASRPCSFWDTDPMRARALVRPRKTEEVSRVMSLCHRLDQPVVTHGGLTGCVAGDSVSGDELVISTERMNRIEEIDPIGRTLTAQAGAVLQTVQEAAAAENLYFPLDLGARGSCTIGGNVATNAGGINVIRHGMMRERVLGLEAVLADGTVVSSMNRMLKNNAGYDLKQLFIGSEGTLGIVTRVVLRLEEAAVGADTALAALDGFDAVAGFLKLLQRELAGSLNAFEVMWGDYYRAVTEPGWHRAPLSRDHAYYVVTEASGAHPESDTARFNAVLEDAVEQGLIQDAVLPKSASERRAVWSIREDFEAVLQNRPAFLYDVSLPIRDMTDYVEAVQAGIRRQWPQGQCFVLGHVGDGNLHLFVCPGTGDDGLHPISDRLVYGPLSHCGGSVSAEHGIGLEKKGWLPASRGETEIELMRRLKRALDPGNLLNRGKIFDL